MKLFGDKDLIRVFQKVQEKAPETISYALSGLVFDARKEVQAKIPMWLHTTRPFMAQSVIYEGARPSRLTASVGFHKRAHFAPLLEQGGTREPQKKAIAVPIDIARTTKGTVANYNKPEALRAKLGVWAGKIGGVEGIWQRSKRIPLKLLYLFQPRVKYNKKFMHFFETVHTSVQRNYKTKFKEAVLKMLSK